MDEELDIVVTGFDVDARQAEAGLCSVFGLDGVRARRFVRHVPVVAKRSVTAPAAERYVHALQSIGARVELRPVASREAESTSSAPAISSLPVPTPSMIARLGETARVERETLDAIRRFRADEGLDGEDDLAPDLDPRNPRIPRPPAVPHDLARMSNAKRSRGIRPRWMLTDPLEQGEDSAPPPRLSSRPHTDAALPPPPSHPPAARPASATTSRSGAEPRARERPGSHSGRPSAPVGLAHAARASVRPGLGLFSWWQFKEAQARKPGLRAVLVPIAAVLVTAVAGAYLWQSGALLSQAGRRERALRAEGIEPGEYAEAAAWLQAPDHGVEGLSAPAARELVDRLVRAGARSVLAVQIHESESGKRAGGLVIELPEAADRRRTILWLTARARGPQVAVPAEDGRYHLLTFP